MTVSVQNPTVSYTAGGSATVFAYPFRILVASDLDVFINGALTTTGFTIAGVGNPAGGSVTFATPPVTGTIVRLQRSTPMDRTTDYAEGGALRADVLDADFDRIVIMMQDLEQQLDDADSELARDIAELDDKVDQINEDLTNRIDQVEEDLTNRIDQVEEDLNDSTDGVLQAVEDAEAAAEAAEDAADIAVDAAAGVASAISPVSFPDYDDLRAYTGPAAQVYLTGYQVTVEPSGHAGAFTRDDGDTETADNAGTVIVDVLGRRWWRVYNGAVELMWFIPSAEHAAIRAGTSTYDVVPDFNRMQESFDINEQYVHKAIPSVSLPTGKVRIDSTLYLYKTMHLFGHGGAATGNDRGASIIEVAAGQTGIRTHLHETFGSGGWSTPWVAGASYVAGYCVNVSRVDFTTGNGIYRCITPGPGVTADLPLHKSGTVTGADGYAWEFIRDATASSPILENFALVSLGGTTGISPEGDEIGHGVHANMRFKADAIRIIGFPGDGWYIYAGATAQSPQRGNANNFRIFSGRVTGCRNGLYINGPDSNAGSVFGLDCSGNRGWGVWEDSFLGNTFVGLHTANNGLGATVQYDGLVYVCTNITGASTTIPGTNGSIWWNVGFPPGGGQDKTMVQNWASGGIYAVGDRVLMSNHGTYSVTVSPGTASTVQPTQLSGTTAVATGDGYSWALPTSGSKVWFSGMTDLIEGGAYKFSGASQVSVAVGCYAEGGQPSKYAQSTMAFWSIGGGQSTTPDDSSGYYYGPGGSNLLKAVCKDSLGNQWTYDIGAKSAATDFLIGLSHPTLIATTLRWTIDHTTGVLAWQDQGTSGSRSEATTLAGTNVTFGRTEPVPHAKHFPRLMVGNFNFGSPVNARAFGNGTAPPTAGESARGDTVLHQSPVLGGNVGWVCTTTGYNSGATAWTAGTDYSTASYVTNGGRAYHCTRDPGSGSQVMPTHGGGATMYADGFEWTVLGAAPGTFTNWISGTNYAAGANILATALWTSGTDYALNAVVLAGNRFYKVVTDPGAVPSTVMPTFTSGAPRTMADGYRWALLSTAEFLASGAPFTYYTCSVDPGTIKASVAPVHTTGQVIGADGYGWTHISATPAVWAPFGNNVLEGTVVYDPPSLAAGVVDATQTTVVTGAALGDAVTASFSLNTQGVRLDAWVSAANVVSFRFVNPAGGATVDLASGTVKLRVIK